MGRKKTYSREEAAQSAFQLFWEKGYEHTSLRDLEEATGVNRYGLYDSFKDKEGLFRVCIEQYCAAGDEMLSSLPTDGLDGMLAIIQRYATQAEDDNVSRYGCMVVTSLLQQDGMSEEIQLLLKTHIESLLAYFRTVLVNEQEAGNLRPGLVVEECAEFMHMSLIGLASMTRIGPGTKRLRLAAQAALATVRSWSVAAEGAATD